MGRWWWGGQLSPYTDSAEGGEVVGVSSLYTDSAEGGEVVVGRAALHIQTALMVGRWVGGQLSIYRQR